MAGSSDTCLANVDVNVSITCHVIVVLQMSTELEVRCSACIKIRTRAAILAAESP